jgi:hypothetical protein
MPLLNLNTMTHKNFLLLAVPVFCCFMMRPIAGKANVAGRGLRTDTIIPARDLKAYEGYYKMGDAYIHISAVLNSLVLQQMWDDKEIAFAPRTALEFVNDDGNFPLKFTKDKNGNATQVLAFKRDLWKKVKE